MNEEKIGRLIALARNNIGLTQRQLAERIGVSDKTISKWECGRSIPDLSYLESLCNALSITMNELISGELLTEQSYSAKAEENIMTLMKENERIKKGSAIKLGLGVILSALSIFLMFAFTQYGMASILLYFDIPTVILLIVMNMATIFLSGKRGIGEILLVLKDTAIPISLVLTLVQSVIVMAKLENIALLGANIAVCMLPIIYGVLEYMTVYLISQHIYNE